MESKDMELLKTEEKSENKKPKKKRKEEKKGKAHLYSN